MGELPAAQPSEMVTSSVVGLRLTGLDKRFKETARKSGVRGGYGAMSHDRHAAACSARLRADDDRMYASSKPGISAGLIILGEQRAPGRMVNSDYAGRT